MPKVTQTTIRCPKCGQPVNAMLERLIDAEDNPDSKMRLLSGRMNVAQCPNCGTAVPLATPLLYHDPKKELLVAFVPMELNLRQDEQEKIVGDLMRELPKAGFKGYMFQPRRALTMQGLIDQILEADGVTPEMMERQRARVQLAQTLLQTAEDQLPDFIQQHDVEVDAQFMQTLSLLANRMLQEGQPELAEQIIAIQNLVVEYSSFGQKIQQQQAAQEQVVREVAADLQALGSQMQHTDIVELTLKYADDDERLQALVGLARAALDYAFFQELTLRIGQAPTDQRDKLEAMRTRLNDLTTAIDQQTQMALQNAAGLLQLILNSPRPEHLIAANLPMIDDAFMAVLSANIQEAERRSDLQASAKLKAIYQQVLAFLQQNMQPEVRFINELLGAETDDDVRAMIAEHAQDYGEELLHTLDDVGEMFASRGDDETVDRLRFLRGEVAQVLG